MASIRNVPGCGKEGAPGLGGVSFYDTGYTRGFFFVGKRLGLHCPNGSPVWFGLRGVYPFLLDTGL